MTWFIVALLALSSLGNALGYIVTGNRTNLIVFVLTAMIATNITIFI